MNSNMDDWLNAYSNNVFKPVPSVMPDPCASTSISSGDSPVASASQGSTSDQKAAKGAAKDKKRRACDACRIRRIRCQRADSRSESCESCTKMDIRCVESKPKARTSQKGARIAQAKMLYGEASSNHALALVVHNSKSQQDQYLPRTPSATEVLMVAAIDAGLLLAELVPAVAKLKVAQFPLLRWIEIANEFQSADGRLSNLDGESQALFLALAALGSRSSHSELIVGKDAPTISQLSIDPTLRSGLTLCEYGRRRERVASELLQVAYRKVNENQLLASPTLRNAATLATVEMLILVYQDSLAFTSTAAKKARPLSAAVASHLRIIAEECNAHPTAPFDYYSVAWTSAIRDALVASVTGRALDFTKSDLSFILLVDEDGPLGMPSPEELCDGCIEHSPLEGPALMKLWSVVMRVTRSFVKEVTQPLAVARPRMKLDFFEEFYTRLRQVRETFNSALDLLEEAGKPPPDQKRVLQYCSDFMLAQAHSFILWRCSEEQLARAKAASSSITGIQRDSFEAYKVRLQALRMRSAEEAFQAARRIMKDIHQTIKPDDTGAAEFFVPGYFIYDGLLIWTSFIADTKTIEEGGRIDYTLADKLADLRTLREAMAITGWSSGTAQPRLEQLDSLIAGLAQQQRIVAIPSPAFFSDYVNMSPPAQNPDPNWLGQQHSFPTSVTGPPSNPNTGYRFTTNLGQNLGSVEDVPQEASSQQMRDQALDGIQTQPNGITSLDFDFTSLEQLPTSQDIEQFLKSVNNQLYH